MASHLREKCLKICIFLVGCNVIRNGLVYASLHLYSESM